MLQRAAQCEQHIRGKSPACAGALSHLLLRIAYCKRGSERTGGPVVLYNVQCTGILRPLCCQIRPMFVTVIGDELGMWRRIVTAAAAATAEAGRAAPTAAFGGSSRPGLRQIGSTISAMRLRGGGANVKQPAPDAAAVTHARLLILLSGAIYGTYPVFLRVCAHDITRPP